MCEQLQPSYLPTELQMHLQSLLVIQKDKLGIVRHLCTLWNIWRHWLTTSMKMWDMSCSQHTSWHVAHLTTKALKYATEKRSMSTTFTSSCTCSAKREPLRPSWRVALLSLVDGFGREALDTLTRNVDYPDAQCQHPHSLHYTDLYKQVLHALWHICTQESGKTWL